MKWLLLFTFFSRAVLSDDLCQFVFRHNPEGLYASDLKQIERINRLETWSGRFRARAYKEDPLTPTAAQKSVKNFEKVEEKLLIGSSLEAVSAYRTLYRKVEGSALLVERYGALSAALRKARRLPVENYTEFFQKEGVIKHLAERYAGRIFKKADLLEQLEGVEKVIRRHARELGLDFESYNYARLNMENLLKEKHCSAVCKQAIKDFQENVGLGGGLDRELYKDFIGGKKGYSLLDIREAFNSHPEAVLAARKQEFYQEGFALIKKYATDMRLLRRLYLQASTSDLVKSNLVFTKFFKSYFDKRFLEDDAIIVKRVSHSGKKPKDKVDMLKKQSKDKDEDRIMTNFSRSKEGAARKAWQEMKEHAKEHEPKLHDKMQEAEELGRKLGDIAKKELKGTKRTIFLIAFAGASWSYVNFDTDSVEEIPLGEGGEDFDGTDFHIEYQREEDTEITEFLSKLYQLDPKSRK